MPKFSDDFEFNEDQDFDELLQRAEEQEFLEFLDKEESEDE